jgi:rhodanese-related sulfurtransferase
MVSMTRWIFKFIFSGGLAAALVGSMVANAADVQGPPTMKTPESKAAKNVSIEEFDKLRANKTNVVLDVRTKKEFEAGHIPGAININVNGADFDDQVGKLDKSKTYLVHCASGVRSARACDKMASMKFRQLYNLQEGFRAWQQAGKPVEK